MLRLYELPHENEHRFWHADSNRDSLMDPLAAEADEPLVSEPTGIDRSFGYLAIGLVVVCLFVLTVFGMTRVEKLAKGRTSPESPRETIPPTEIGGVEK